MSGFFNAILQKISAFASWLLSLVGAILGVAWDLLTDLIAFVVEQLLDLVIAALDAIPFDGADFNPGSYINALPPEVGGQTR